MSDTESLTNGGTTEPPVAEGAAQADPAAAGGGGGLDDDDDQLTQGPVKREALNDGGNLQGLMTGMLGLNLIERPAKFKYGQDFNTYCTRFEEYVQLHSIQNARLHLLFLSNLDERSYKKLKDVSLTPPEKAYCELFLKKYRQVYYPSGETVSHQMQLGSIKQKLEESVDDFSFRLTELANKAYTDRVLRESCSFLAFMQGIRDTDLKVKLNESDVRSYREAVSFAKRIERVANSVGRSQSNDPILYAVQTRPNIWREQTRRPNTQGPPPIQNSNDNSAQPSESRSIGSRSRNPLQQITCWNCGRVGHVRNQCDKPRPDFNARPNHSQRGPAYYRQRNHGGRSYNSSQNYYQNNGNDSSRWDGRTNNSQNYYQNSGNINNSSRWDGTGRTNSSRRGGRVRAVQFNDTDESSAAPARLCIICQSTTHNTSACEAEVMQTNNASQSSLN